MAVILSIGEMRSVVILMQNQPVDNASGGTTDNFIEALRTRGKLTKISGSKGIEAGAIQFDKGFRLVCRFQSALTINQDTRMNVDGQDYSITDWETEDQIQHWYIFKLAKVDA